MAYKYKKVGAAWINEKEDGTQYISIQLEKAALDEAFAGREKANGYLFANEKKETDKQPDYNISIKLD